MKFLKTLGEILKLSFAVALGLVLIAVVLVWVVLNWPGVLINERTLPLAKGFLNEMGVEAGWERASVKIESAGLLTKKIRLQFEGLCVRDSKHDAYRVCFRSADVSAEGSFVRFVPRVKEIGPVALLGGTVSVHPDRFPEGAPEKKEERPFRIEEILPEPIRGAVIQSVRIEVDRWEWLQKERKVEGSLALNSDTRGGMSRIELKTRGDGKAKQGPFWREEEYALDLDMRNPRGFWAWNEWRVKLDGGADLADGRRVDLDARLRPRFVAQGGARDTSRGEDIELGYEIKASSVKDTEVIVAQLDGGLNNHGIDARLRGSARNLIPEIDHLRVENCELNLAREGASGREGRLQVDCPVEVKVPLPPEKLSVLEVPTYVGARLKTNLQLSEFIPSEESQVQGDAELTINPFFTPILTGKGVAQFNLNGTIGEFPKQGTLESWAQLELDIPHFEKVVDRLAHTAWAIPAPIRALQGNMSFRANGDLDLSSGFFPIRFQSRLSSKEQKLDLDAAGTVAIEEIRTKPTTLLKVGVTLTEVKIQLPRLDLGLPPRFFPDPRIQAFAPSPPAEEQAGTVEPETFHYQVAIRTKEKPVLIASNLAQAPVPVNLDLVLVNGEAPSGRIRVSKFPVEFFRRQATVESFNIELADDTDLSKVDGLIIVPYTDYRVRIAITGTIGKPDINLTSDPPLPEEELVSVLLFGQPPDALDSQSSSSVGSTKAAISESAMNLASFFLLAKTPIQSVGYDPATGQVSARVRIAEGTSLSVGGGGDNSAQTVGLRKRLGPHWAITTDVTRLGSDDSSTANAFLEWGYRY